MPLENIRARFTFYDVLSCGFYKRGREDAFFGSFSDTVVDIHRWVTHGEKPLSETCTYVPNPEQQLFRTFCFDMVREGRGAVLVTWNESPSLGDSMASVNASLPVGRSLMARNRIPRGNIPGYPTYFWLDIARNRIATIQFDDLRNGHLALQKYVQEFLTSFSMHCVYRGTGDQRELLGYRQNLDNTALRLFPRFRSYRIRDRSRLEFIRTQRKNVREVIRKTTLHRNIPEERNLLERLFGEARLIGRQTFPSAINVEYKLLVNPTAAEFSELINQYGDAHIDLEHGEWDRVGFRLTNDNTTYWLDSALARCEFDLQIDRDTSGVVTAQSLMNTISARLSNIVRAAGLT